MCFAESIVMGTTPERAFAFLADPATAPIIDPAVISYTPDALPMRAGGTNTIRVRMFGARATLVTRTLEWEEGRRMVLESVRPSQPVRARATHLFEPHPDGVLYTWSMDMIPVGFGGRIAARAMTWFMRRNARQQQARFKREMERADGEPAARAQ